MANTHELFKTFDEKITLTSTKQESLKKSRDALRKDIKNWFSDKEKRKPLFCWQGSYAMKTLINPLNNKDYDLDDGVYLQGYNETEIDSWETPTTVHRWVKDAVKDRTSIDVIDKSTCVRVPYVSGYHIDLPIYILKDDVIYLANKDVGWTESDPKAFKDWFVDKVNSSDYGEQLRRIVKYLKGWADYSEIPLKGIEITILAVNSFDKYDNRDDKSLRNTVEDIIKKLDENFTCVKPVAPGEDLFERKSETKKTTIIKGLKTLKTALDNAISVEDEKEASEHLRAVFGNRFPVGKTTDTSSFAISERPGVLNGDARSA